MPRFALTNRAVADLKSIAVYTQRNWGTKQRNEYVLALDAAFRRIAESPALGLPCDEISAGYRKYLQGSHLIFYKHETTTERVLIVRVLHQRMDVTAQFTGQE